MNERNPETTLPATTTLLRAPWNTAAARLMQSAIEESDPDVVHVHNTWFALGPAAVVAATRRKPTVLTNHNYRMSCVNGLLYRRGVPCTDCVGRSPLPGMMHRCYRDSLGSSAIAALTIQAWRGVSVWDRIDVITAHNPLAKDILISAGAPADHVRLVDNFVTEPLPRSATPSQSNQVLIVGRLSEEKGVSTALEGWQLANPSMDLKVIGDGPLMEEVRAAHGHRVTFTGSMKRDAVMVEMAKSRALLFPSAVFESQPMVLIEAMAAGLPLIATDHPPTRWILDESEAGILVEARSPAAIASAVERLTDDDLVDRMGAASRLTWSRRFTPAHAVDRLESVYQQAIERHRGTT